MNFTAKQFLARLQALQSDVELEKIQRYFKTGKGEYAEGTQFIGVRMGLIFDLAKEFMAMPLDEIEKLLAHKIHEAKVGAVSIMDFQARDKKTTKERQKELFDLYITKHELINNWDLVDRAAPYVVGKYLFDKPRDVLYKLAKSNNMWERRTAIVSTYYFIKNKQTEDTFKIAELLLDDQNDIIHKATGSWLRTTYTSNKKGLMEFLDKYASSMPRVTLRYALEKFDEKEKERYMKIK